MSSVSGAVCASHARLYSAGVAPDFAAAPQGPRVIGSARVKSPVRLSPRGIGIGCVLPGEDQVVGGEGLTVMLFHVALDRPSDRQTVGGAKPPFSRLGILEASTALPVALQP